MIPQDLHIHSQYSVGDGALVEQQTLELIARVRHAETIGISDHFECIIGAPLERYSKEVTGYGFVLGCEVSRIELVHEAADYDFEYYVYHCLNTDEGYDGLEVLLATNRPVIVAHPMMLGTNLNRVPRECLVEINNRYVWRDNYEAFFTPYLDKFRFVFSSDAHQPHWLNQNVARNVGEMLGVAEQILFPNR